MDGWVGGGHKVSVSHRAQGHAERTSNDGHARAALQNALGDGLGDGVVEPLSERAVRVRVRVVVRRGGDDVLERDELGVDALLGRRRRRRQECWRDWREGESGGQREREGEGKGGLKGGGTHLVAEGGDDELAAELLPKADDAIARARRYLVDDLAARARA